MAKPQVERITLLALFTVSGFAGLIYESIWSHYLKTFLGHAAHAQTLVLVIFMGGMAAGAWWVALRTARLRNLLLAYAIVEAIIGLLGLAFDPLFHRASDWAFATAIPAIDSPTLVATFKWTLGAALILPQSILLGMTFPLMSGAIVRRAPEQSGRTLALLYFTNSLGAAVGVLVSGFVLIDRVGLPGTILTAALMNLLLALLVWLLARRGLAEKTAATSAARIEATPGLGRAILVGAFATGAAAFMYEIAWIRMLALVLGSSTHAFELMLSAFILGIALGGLWVKSGIQRTTRPVQLLGTVMLVMATVALLTLQLYNASFGWMAWIVEMFSPNEAGYIGYHLGSQAIAMALMVPTTVFCGMTLPLMTHVLVRGRAGESAIGAVYAANTLGSIVGIVLAVHLLMPLVGVKGLVIAGAALHATLGVSFLFRPQGRRIPWASFALAGMAGIAFMLAIFVIQLDPRRMTSGVFRHGQWMQPADSNVTFFEHGKTASISLVEKDGMVAIATNGKPDAAIDMRPGSPATPDEYTMVVAAALPLAMHAAPHTIANIGIGSGLTSHVLLADPGVATLDTIEIEPAMAKAARQGFMARVRNTFQDPRSHVHFEDAKTFFAANRRRYDVIVAEPSNPWVSGVASLFSDEFYERLTHYLEPDGMLVQWLQVYETDTTTLTSVLRALAPHFADFGLYNTDDSNVLIVAVRRGSVPQPAARVFGLPALRAELARVDITSTRDMDSRFLGDRSLLLPALAAARVPANSDFYPYVDQHAIRARVLRRNALEVTRIATDPTAMLDLLRRRPPPSLAAEVRSRPLLEFDRLNREANLLARSIVSSNIDPLTPAFARQVSMLSASAAQCARAGARRAWLDSVFEIVQSTTPTLDATSLDKLWRAIDAQPCAAKLASEQQTWLHFLRAVALRRGAEVMALGNELLGGNFVFDSQAELAYAARATTSAMLGQGNVDAARSVLARFAGDMVAAGTSKWSLNLLAGLAGLVLVEDG